MKTYYIDYNCKYIASFKSIKRAMAYIKRKGLKDDYDNMLYIIDNEGNQYDTVTGLLIN